MTGIDSPSCAFVFLRVLPVSCFSLWISKKARFVAGSETDQRAVNAAPERDDLEKLAHFCGRQQFLHASSKRQSRDCRIRGRMTQQLDDSAVDEEVCLRGIAEQIQTGIDAGFRNGREIDLRAQVLKAGKIKRIVVRAMPVVAHQRASGSLWMIVFSPPEAVIDQQQHSFSQRR